MLLDKALYIKAKDVAFNALFDLLPINFSWMDKEGYVLGCNRRVLESLHLHGFEDIVGKHTTEVASNLAWQNTKKVVETGKSLSVEEVHTCEDGTKIYFLSLKSPIRSAEGEVVAVVNVGIDITDRKRAEEELKFAKEAAEIANRAKTEFLNNMRHDLRTPFSGILGLADLLESEETDPKKKENLHYITESAQILLDHINEIFEFVEVESGELPIIDKQFDMYQLLFDLSKMVLPAARDKQLNFTLTKDKNLPQFLVGDSTRTQRILMNFLSNAIKFTHKGYVNIHVDLLEASEKTQLIQFKIQDSGIGISQNKRDFIFERFNRVTPSYSGLYPGKGLGLKIVKQFLEEIEGEFHFESELGKGSTFYVLIPYKKSLCSNIV